MAIFDVIVDWRTHYNFKLHLNPFLCPSCGDAICIDRARVEFDGDKLVFSEHHVVTGLGREKDLVTNLQNEIYVLKAKIELLQNTTVNIAKSGQSTPSKKLIRMLSRGR